MKDPTNRGRNIARMLVLAVFFVTIIMLLPSGIPVAMGGKPTPAPGAFNTTSIDTKGWVGDYNRIATDQNGHAYITYYDWSQYALKYATNAGGSWVIEKIAVIGSKTNQPRGGVADILVDSSNAVHIVYINFDHNLVYAKKVGGTWTAQPVFPGRTIQGQISMALDGNGGLHFSYYDHTGQEAPSLRYASYNNDQWISELVYQGPDPYWSASLAIGPNNFAHMVYIDWSEYKLRYATNSDGWVSNIVDPDAFAAYNSDITVDKQGKLHIAYSAYTADPNLPNPAYLYVKYAHGSVGSWDCHVVDDTRGYLEEWTPIGVDSSGVVHIVYNLYTTNLVDSGSVKYVTFTGETMSAIKVVDPSSGSGFYLDMVVDSQAQPKVHISFVKYVRFDLKYAISK